VEETMRRKPSERIESVEEKHEIIETMTFPNSIVYDIDASMKYEQELIEIKNFIWNNIRKL